MAKDKSTIRFWLRTDKPNKDGTSAITLVYQVQGQRKYYWMPDLKIHSTNWDINKQQAIYIDKKKAKTLLPPVDFKLLLSQIEVNEINDKLEEKRKDIKNIEKRFELDKTPFSSQMVLEHLKEKIPGKTKKETPDTFIVDFIDRYVKDNAGTHKFRTLQVYSGLATHLRDFENKYGTRATFEKLDIPFLRAFTGYLAEPKAITLSNGSVRNVAGMNNITIAKQISTLKTLLKYARTLYGIIVNQAYQDFKVTRKDSGLEVVTLTNDEFLTLYNMDLSENKRLDQVRDVFCFSCATGLRYSDLEQLKREHIRHSAIRMTAAKTGQRLDIPLNPFSQAILEKYKHRHAMLPIISGQKTNEYLKELGALAGIDTPVEKVREYGVKREAVLYKKYELMSIHMGRRTFTTLSLEKGMAPQEVMSITGHTTYKAFKRYVDVTNERKKTVMAKAWGEVEDNKLKAV